MDDKPLTPRQRQAAIYREWAARCLRNGNCFFTHCPTKHVGGPAYSRMEKYCNGSVHVPIVCNATAWEKALFLCFFAAMVEAGDA